MIAIIDLGAEETDFLINIIENQGEKFKVTTDEAEIIRSDKIIFPASGDASTALRKLHLLNLFTILRICKKPLLGICLGMHLMGEYSEDGSKACLGMFPIKTKRFDPALSKKLYRGMHSISIKKESLLYKDVQDGESFYFFTSYYFPESDLTTAIADNNMKFSASVENGNFYGIQFSPEKSGEVGKKIIQNFIELPVL